MRIFLKMLTRHTETKLHRNHFSIQIRFWVGSMTVPLGIIVCVACDRIFFRSFNSPHLDIPTLSQINYSSWVTLPQWDKLCTYGTHSAVKVHLIAALCGFIVALTIFVEVALNR